MEMTNADIVRDYQAAADKKKQVQILADLNQVKPEEIVEILKAGGVDHRSLPRAKKAPKEEPIETVPSEEIAEIAEVVIRPKVKPRHLHRAERMMALFAAIFDDMRQKQKPDPEWLDEFDELWCSYLDGLEVRPHDPAGKRN